jgi:NADH-quinone oxidoreductase subunit N
MSQYFTSNDFFVLRPAILLALFACGILLIDNNWFFPNLKQRKLAVILLTVVCLVCTGLVLWRQQEALAVSGATEMTAFQGSLTLDGFGLFFNWIFVVAALIVSVVSFKYLEIEGENHGEYYALILLAECGMFFLATGTDLVTLFIGLELMALSFYVMVGFLRTERRSNEAAMKYLILGAFSSGFLA